MSAITAGGDLIHYEVLGRGRPVVLVHGWIGSWRYWVPTMQHLQTHYRLYALDLYGYGDSAKNPAKYTLEHQVALLEDFMQDLGIAKAALIGHGLGAMVCAEYARRYPDRVPRLILVGAPLYDPGDLDKRAPVARKVRQRAAEPAAAPGLTPNAATIMSASAAMRLALVEAGRARAGGQLPPELEAAATVSRPEPVAPAHNPLLPLMTAMPPEEILARCFRRGEPNFDKLSVDVARMDARAPRGMIEQFDSGRLLDTLRLLDIPMLIMHGTDDPLIPPPADDVLNYLTLERENSLLPILLPNVRHFPMIEDDRFFRLANDFLEAPDPNRIAVKERWRRRNR